MDTYGNLTITGGGVAGVAGGPILSITTRTVEVKDGWVGQILVGGKIIWETPATVKVQTPNGLTETRRRAQAGAAMAAEERVQAKLAQLFGEE